MELRPTFEPCQSVADSYLASDHASVLVSSGLGSLASGRFRPPDCIAEHPEFGERVRAQFVAEDDAGGETTRERLRIFQRARR